MTSEDPTAIIIVVVYQLVKLGWSLFYLSTLSDNIGPVDSNADQRNKVKHVNNPGGRFTIRRWQCIEQRKCNQYANHKISEQYTRYGWNMIDGFFISLVYYLVQAKQNSPPFWRGV